MGEGDPLLAVARVEEEEQADREILAFVVCPDLVERPPRGERATEADQQPDNLPYEGNRRDDAGGEDEDRGDEGAEGRKGRDEFGGTEEMPDPGECPVVPVKADPGGEQSVGEEGEEGEEGGDGFAGEFWHGRLSHKLQVTSHKS